MIRPIPVRWTEGLLADAAEANLHGRLLAFIEDEESPALQMFTPERREASEAGDWYGEHAGKWLVAAQRAFERTGNEELGERIALATRFLIANQEPPGYLGTYAKGSAARFTAHPGAGIRTWDLWNHAWMILGFLAVGQVEAARKIGDLMVSTFKADTPPILRQGNHKGLSSLVCIEPLAKLTLATGDERYLALARETLARAEAHGLNVLAWASNPNFDPSQCGTGKIYQLLWVFRGLLAMNQRSADQRYVDSVKNAWRVIRDHHLDPTGGPWGGIADHKEVFNPTGYFNPRGLVETCSSATWLSLTHDLYLLDSDPMYLAEIEKTLLNAIVGAQGENGQEWIYFSFANGRINHTYHWACCKSSGALAIEAAADMVAARVREELWLNLLLPCEFDGLKVSVGDELTLSAEQPVNLSIRIPEWLEPDLWGPGQRLTLSLQAGESKSLPLRSTIRATKKTYTLDHHGQEIVREDYLSIARGPYVYALESRDDVRYQLPFLDPRQAFRVRDGETVELLEPGRPARLMRRYFEAGDRRDGAYRTTWIPVEWQ